MLSAVIATRHSYPAVPLAGQLVDQRSVHPGPLVDTSPISRSSDYIFIRSQLGTRTVASYPCELSFSKNDSSTHESAYLSAQVVTGSINVLKNGEVGRVLGTPPPLLWLGHLGFRARRLARIQSLFPPGTGFGFLARRLHRTNALSR